MRARHRHFNAGNAGASLVLDSRRITGISNGSNLGTWSDISGNSNNATQTTAGSQPIFRETGTNGLPTVEADPAAPGDFMETQITTQFGDFFCQCVYRDIGSALNYERLVDKKFDTGFWIGRDGTIANKWGGGLRQTISPFGDYTTNIVDGNFGITSMGRNGSTKKQWVNGTEFANVNVGSTLMDNTKFYLFYDVNNPANKSSSQLSSVILMGSQPDDALRKKIQFSVAYSFKIACS